MQAPTLAVPVTAANFAFDNSEQEQAYNEIMAWIQRMDPRKTDHKNNLSKTRDSLVRDLAALFEWRNPDQVYTLEGYAGVGKTVLLAKMIVDLSELGFNIAVAAPTKKAVGVVQSKVLEYAGNRVVSAVFKTVHSIAGINMREDDDGELKAFRSDRSSIHTYHILFVDEGSMVDSMYQLPAIVENAQNCLIIFVGDSKQLRPVQSADRSLVFKFPQKSTISKIVRQAEGSPIIQATVKLRALMDRPEEGRVQLSDLIEWLPPEYFVRGRRGIEDRVLDDQKKGIDTRAIAWRNKTVISINQNVHFDLYPETKAPFIAGERVMVQQATRGIDIETGKSVPLVNSEELTLEWMEEGLHETYSEIRCFEMVLKDAFGSETMVKVPKLMSAYVHHRNELFQTLQDLVRKNAPRDAISAARGAAWTFANAFAEIRHTYATTAHKSQGSTYDYAAIDFMDLMGIVSDEEFNEAFYVGLSRARYGAVIGY